MVISSTWGPVRAVVVLAAVCAANATDSDIFRQPEPHQHGIADFSGAVSRDAIALLLFNAALGGPRWVVPWPADPASDPCTARWHGVECAQSGRVTALRLPGNGLSGSIPPAIAQLAELRDLDLSDNFISGPIPDTLTRLTRLARVDLSQNHFTGTQPALDSLPDLVRWSVRGSSELMGVVPSSVLLRNAGYGTLFDFDGTRVVVGAAADAVGGGGTGDGVSYT